MRDSTCPALHAGLPAGGPGRGMGTQAPAHLFFQLKHISPPGTDRRRAARVTLETEHNAMANMSYCRFENTLGDLRDCQAHLLDRHKNLLDVIQVRYNLLERDAEKVLFPKAIEHGIGVIVRIPLLFGLLTGKFTRDSRFGEDDHRRMNLSPEKLDSYLARLEQLRPLFDRYPDQTMTQVSLRFCITHAACHTVIPGAKTPEQARDNSRAGELGPLTADDLRLVEGV